MRGGLDDALDKLARRDELRRRTAGEATGTPPAVQELVEAIAAVVGRNPKLAVTVGVEGVGDPMLLHFAVEDGVVQVSVDNSVATRVADSAPTAPKHADFDIEPEEPAFASPPPAAEPAYASSASSTDAGQETRRISYDDSNRYDPGTGYNDPAYAANGMPAEPVASDHRYERHRRYDDDFTSADFFTRDTDPIPDYPAQEYPSRNGGQYPPHPFAAAPPPPVPPMVSRPTHTEQHRAREDSSAAGRRHGQRGPEPRVPEQRAPEQPPAQRGMPTPLPKPIPLKVDSEETELAAKRLAALLRDNPSLLRQSPPD